MAVSTTGPVPTFTSLLNENKTIFTATESDEDGDSPMTSAEDFDGGASPEWSWMPYVFVFGTLFAVIIVWSLMNLVVLIHRSNIASRGYHITLNILMLMVGSLRLASFTFSRLAPGTVHIAVVWVLSHLPVPCLNSAFFLLWSALKAMTRMRLVAGQLFRPWFLAVLVIINLSVAVSADLITLYLVPGGLVMTLCRVYFVVLGAVGSGAFLWDFQALYKATVVNRRWITDHGDTKDTSTTSSTANSPDNSESTGSTAKLAAKAPEKKPTKLPVVVKVTLVAACLLLSISVWNSCDLTLKSPMVDESIVKSPAINWTYKSLMRFSESAMAATILFVTSLPLYRR